MLAGEFARQIYTNLIHAMIIDGRNIPSNLIISFQKDLCVFHIHEKQIIIYLVY
jgi:hypothetical protein